VQRTLLIVLAAAIVAAGAATAATIVLTDNDRDEVGLTSPLPVPTSSASPEATTEVVTPLISGERAAEESVAPASTRTARPRATRSASSVDCENEPKFCGPREAVNVSDDRYDFVTTSGQLAEYPGAAKITMDTEIRDADDNEAQDGDEAGSIHALVEVENTTDRTLVFPKREIVLDIFRNGRLWDRLITKGPGFEMTPGGKMKGTFDRPLTEDGEYTWQAKTWYYTKR
jgi:hypothetical protein